MTRLLIDRRLRFSELQKKSGLSGGNLSTHLDVLYEVGYVSLLRDEKKASPRKVIQVTPAGEAAFRAYIQQLKALISTYEAPNPEPPA